MVKHVEEFELILQPSTFECIKPDECVGRVNLTFDLLTIDFVAISLMETILFY